MSNTSSGPYAYFKGAKKDKTYSECLSILKRAHVAEEPMLISALQIPSWKLKMLPYSDSQYGLSGLISARGAAYDWQFTLPGAVDLALKRAINKPAAYMALEAYLNPLEFAAQCGLPKAMKMEQINETRKSVLAWIDDSLNINSVHCKSLDPEIRENIFNSGIDLGLAVNSLDNSVFEEWALINRIDNAVISHVFSDHVRDHIRGVYSLCDTLNDNRIAAHVCKHNLIVFNPNDDITRRSEFMNNNPSFGEFICDRSH